MFAERCGVNPQGLLRVLRKGTVDGEFLWSLDELNGKIMLVKYKVVEWVDHTK
jgi:hypothetical protein